MRISFSAKEMYSTCPYSYFLHYLLKLRSSEEKSPLAFGNAVDAGLNTLLETRDLDKAITAFKSTWNVYKSIHIKYSKSDYVDDIEGDTDQERGWNSLHHKGQVLINEYNTQIMPRIKEVIKVQIDLNVENHVGDKLVVKTDFICKWEDDRIILFDNKTSSVKYEDDSVMKSEQLATYYELLKEEYKIEACGFIVLPKRINKNKKPAIDIKVIIDHIPEKTIKEAFHKYDDTISKVKAGSFPQNKSSCKGKYGLCTYYEFCHNSDTKGLVDKMHDEKK